MNKKTNQNGQTNVFKTKTKKNKKYKTYIKSHKKNIMT